VLRVIRREKSPPSQGLRLAACTKLIERVVNALNRRPSSDDSAHDVNTIVRRLPKCNVMLDVHQ
jgi:hypothetical protein